MLSDVIFHDFTENSRGGIKHFTLMLLVYIIYLFSHFKSDSVILLVVFCVILLIFVTLLFIFYSFHFERFCVFLNVRSLCCFFCCFMKICVWKVDALLLCDVICISYFVVLRLFVVAFHLCIVALCHLTEFCIIFILSLNILE